MSLIKFFCSFSYRKKIRPTHKKNSFRIRGCLHNHLIIHKKAHNFTIFWIWFNSQVHHNFLHLFFIFNYFHWFTANYFYFFLSINYTTIYFLTHVTWQQLAISTRKYNFKKLLDYTLWLFFIIWISGSFHYIYFSAK